MAGLWERNLRYNAADGAPLWYPFDGKTAVLLEDAFVLSKQQSLTYKNESGHEVVVSKTPDKAEGFEELDVVVGTKRQVRRNKDRLPTSVDVKRLTNTFFVLRVGNTRQVEASSIRRSSSSSSLRKTSNNIIRKYRWTAYVREKGISPDPIARVEFKLPLTEKRRRETVDYPQKFECSRVGLSEYEIEIRVILKSNRGFKLYHDLQLESDDDQNAFETLYNINLGDLSYTIMPVEVSEEISSVEHASKPPMTDSESMDDIRKHPAVPVVSSASIIETPSSTKPTETETLPYALASDESVTSTKIVAEPYSALDCEAAANRPSEEPLSSDKSSSSSSSLNSADELPPEPRKIPTSVLVLGKCLGGGAFGAVHQASIDPKYHFDDDYNGPATQREVAVKKLHGGYSAALVEKLRAEARVLWRIPVHSNVVQMLGISIDEAMLPSMVMELCTGGDLHTVIHSKTAETSIVTPKRLVLWSRQIAQGMQHLHDCGVYHRDLKPKNILVKYPLQNSMDIGTLKISDFGLAKQLGQGASAVASAYHTMAGTVLYMAPEILRGERSSKASDVWSFGVIVWELLTGVVPFSYWHTEHIGAILLKIGMGERLWKPKKSWPIPFGTLLDHCLEPNHRQRLRFQRAVEILGDSDVEDLVKTDLASFKMLRVEWQATLEKMVGGYKGDSGNHQKLDVHTAEVQDRVGGKSLPITLQDFVQDVLGDSSRQYMLILEENGFEEPSDFDMYSESELENMGFRKVHARRIKVRRENDKK